MAKKVGLLSESVGVMWLRCGRHSYYSMKRAVEVDGKHLVGTSRRQIYADCAVLGFAVAFAAAQALAAPDVVVAENQMTFDRNDPSWQRQSLVYSLIAVWARSKRHPCSCGQMVPLKRIADP